MPRCRNLKDVAAGLLGAFVGRHNDIDGYWALGMLRADHPGGNGQTQFSLLDCRVVPATPSSELTVAKFAGRLRAMLANHGFAPHDLLAAEIVIEFDAAVQIPAGCPVSFGDPFRCTVTLADRLGKSYLASNVGRCALHNPRHERRSARAPHPGTSTRQNEQSV